MGFEATWYAVGDAMLKRARVGAADIVYDIGSGDGGIVSLFFFQAEDGIRDLTVTGVQTCALPIYRRGDAAARHGRRRSGRSPRPSGASSGRSRSNGSTPWKRACERTARACCAAGDTHAGISRSGAGSSPPPACRSEEHTSELQSQSNLVCRLLLGKKKTL